MGFDLSGENPQNEVGDYFRNNVWWWRALWNYTCLTCCHILTERDQQAGGFNDGHLISKTKSIKIANTLNRFMDMGHTEKWGNKYMDELNNLPDETCKLCKGTKEREFEGKMINCNGCNGKGTTRPWEASYPFSVENVKEFAKFVEHSGGFRIC